VNLFGFDFGKPHEIAGITLGRFSNYYFVLLLLIGFIILVFTRLNNSRIGRGWVAIREDERAAEAMGVNTFGLKLFAFAVGAFLAGLAGTIKAHQDTAVLAGPVHLPRVRVPLGRRRPRWYGDRGGRPRRRHDPQAAAGEAAVLLRLPPAHSSVCSSSS
jgi:hypothetical protein